MKLFSLLMTIGDIKYLLSFRSGVTLFDYFPKRSKVNRLFSLLV